MMPKHSLSARRLTALLAVSLLTLAACDSGGGLAGGSTVDAVQIVTLPNNQTLTNLVPATTRQMFGVPVNSAGHFVDRDVTFASSNDAVFTVSATGLMTAVAGGNAYLRATAGGKTDSILIAVRFPVGTVTISNAGLTLRREQTQQLTVVTLDTQGATVTGRTITWSSDTPANVTVSATGLAGATAAAADASTATISATVNNAADNAANVVGNRLVTVNGDAAIATITITGGPAGGFIGSGSADVPLTATARSGLGNVIATAFTWNSSSAPRATVDAAGVVDILTPGTTNITAVAPAFPGGPNVTGTLALEIATSLVPGANAIATLNSAAVRFYAVYADAGDAFTVETNAGTAGDIDMFIWNPGVTGVVLSVNAATGGETANPAAGRICVSAASGNAETCNINPTITGWYRIGMAAWALTGAFTDNVIGVTATYTP